MRVKELSKIQEKHLLALISREGAVIAKQSLLDDVKQHAKCVRKEKQELYEKLENAKEKHINEMAEIYERCRVIEQASRDAFNAMVDEKRQKAAEVFQESRQLKVQMTKQREEEMQRKIKLIQEIKTIQSLRKLPHKDFDPTESSGLGLLCEMSLAELKERLFWMKMKLNEEIENRKVVVHRERERQKNMIKDTQKALQDYKVNKRTVSSSKDLQQSTSESMSPEVDALRRQLEKRKAVRLQKEIALRSK
ncbi:cilia- and flagella-associated protein 99 [Halictus rubicundus]|uniref:cilia- and flagella-associated protein 99 n=1 Tax=Halictus rubicundus TaxID=77578 RepID=UPI0040360E4C